MPLATLLVLFSTGDGDLAIVLYGHGWGNGVSSSQQTGAEYQQPRTQHLRAVAVAVGAPRIRGPGGGGLSAGHWRHGTAGPSALGVADPRLGGEVAVASTPWRFRASRAGGVRKSLGTKPDSDSYGGAPASGRTIPPAFFSRRTDPERIIMERD